jgi:hypothetical protein
MSPTSCPYTAVFFPPCSFFAHHEAEIRAPSAAPQPLPCYADIIAKTDGDASSSMAAAVAAAAAADAAGQALMLHVPAPPTPGKHADSPTQQLLLRQLSPSQQQLQQQVLGLSLDNSSSSLFRGCSDMLETATLLKSLQTVDGGAGCKFGYSISDPGDNSCSTSHSNSSNALPALDLPPGLDCAYTARRSIDNSSTGPVPVAFFADSLSPVPPLYMQGGIGGHMLPQQQQQFVPVAGVSSSSYQPQQPLQLATIDPATLSAMLQRMNVTSPDMQQQQQTACNSMQLQVPVSQPTHSAMGSPAYILQQQQAMYVPQQHQHQQQQGMFVPQQQQELLQLVSAPAAAPLAAPPGIMYATTAAGSGVRPQLLVPVAAGPAAGSGYVQLASPSGMQQLQQLPATAGIEVGGFAGQQYTLQQLPW